MRRQQLGQNGDTLIEVVLALVVLTSVLVGAFAVARVNRADTANGLQRTQAINLVQEQYSALRAFRDGSSSNPGSWGAFESGVYNAIKALPGCIPSSAAPSIACSFHLERNGISGIGYGQWVPCPGLWFPPLDADNGWIGTSCPGSARTQTAQPNIQVQVTLMSQLNCNGSGGLPGNPYVNFQVSAIWDVSNFTAGNTSLATLLADTQGTPTTC